MQWSGPATPDGQAHVREFTLPAGVSLASGALWRPADATASRRVPVVLVQHGGSSHKRGADVAAWAAFFAARGLATLALDGPVHGARLDAALAGAPPLAVRERFLELWRTQDEHVGQMVAEWRAVIAALAQVEGVDATRIAWVGLSMGTAYGLPLLAEERAIGAAVVGMWGLGFANSDCLARAAPQVRMPLLFQQKWDDELFTRAGQIELFTALGAADKRLNVYPGGHVAVQGAQLRDVGLFVDEHLGR